MVYSPREMTNATSPSPLPHAYIISLAKDAHRRDRLTRRLQEIGFDFTIVAGIDGRAFDVSEQAVYDRKTRLRFFGRDLLGAELGCLLSHRKAIAAIAECDLPYGLVLEDDCVIRDEFVPCMTAIVSMRPPPDLVRFIDKDKLYTTRHKVLAPLTGHMNLVRTQGTPGGAYAYFISRTGAQRILKHLQNVYLPVDVILGHSWTTGVDNLIAIPSPVTHAALEDTNIGDDRFDKTLNLSGIRKAVFPLFRAFYKVRESVMKRMYFSLRGLSG